MASFLVTLKSASQNPLYVILGGLLMILGVIVRRIYFHPLSSYPGPFLAKFSPFYIFLGVARGKRTMMGRELLQRYGSPCRISTNELVYSDPASIAEIYGQSSQPCLKDPSLYEPFSVTGARNVFNAVDKNVHSRMRRLLSNGFAAKTLLEREELFMGKINQFINLAFRGKEGQIVDVYSLSHYLFLDITSYLGFGQSLNTLEGENRDVMQDLEAFITIMPATGYIPGLTYLPVSIVQDALKRVRHLGAISHSMINEYLHRTSGPDQKVDVTQSLLYRLANSVDPETGTSLSQVELEENAILFLAAGSGTTAAALMWLLWQVGRLPEVHKRLAQEIRQAFPNRDVSPTFAELSKLPYLQNVIEESLRLWGPLSSHSPRVSPGKVIAGKYVPAGVIVGSNPYATARDPSVFPQPEVFDPSRWEKATSMMRLMSRPFSSGPRNCIGKHLAEINLRLAVTRLYQLYDIVPDVSMTEAVMQPMDVGAFKLWEERCLLIATPAPVKN